MRDGMKTNVSSVRHYETLAQKLEAASRGDEAAIEDLCRVMRLKRDEVLALASPRDGVDTKATPSAPDQPRFNFDLRTFALAVGATLERSRFGLEAKLSASGRHPI